MTTRRIFVSILVAVAMSVACIATARDAAAGAYPTNTCVGAKIKAAGKKCKDDSTAWSTWDKSQNATARDAKLTASNDKFTKGWQKADDKALKAGIDCADTTLSLEDMRTVIDAAITDIVTTINAGLDLGDPAQGSCGGKLIKAAGKKCDAFLKAESKLVKKPLKDPKREKRDLALDKASTKFADAWAKVMMKSCPTTADVATVEDKIDELYDTVVTDTTMSPNVDDTQFTTISPTGTVQYEKRDLTPKCSGIHGHSLDYHFFVKRGSTNKLLMYYQGGGACWSNLTCGLETCDLDVNPAGGDNPQNQQFGFGDLSNPDNPFREWNIVFTAYCTCDIHFGDQEQSYISGGSGVHTNHFGYQNARVVEKWAREHFVNPEEVFVTGSSAGAYGALFNAPLLEAVWPASKFSVLGDAGNGVITPDFLNTPGYGFQNWNFEANLPTYIPGVLESIQTGAGMPAYTEAVAAYFPDTAWANYSTAYDGGQGGQTGFYNVMVNKNNPLVWTSWWLSTCDWHDNMRAQALATAAAIGATPADNYRYYIGRGSRHTGWGSNTVVYSDDAIGGTPALKDWVNSMRNRDSGWVDTECTDCTTLLPGDPQPTTGTDPFFDNGSGGVEIICP
jgi:hypothetical protein